MVGHGDCEKLRDFCLNIQARRPIRRGCSTSRGAALKVTIDSTEPLGDALRVIGALYNVTLNAVDETTKRRSDNRKPKREGRSAPSVSTSEIRSWAQANGHEACGRPAITRAAARATSRNMPGSARGARRMRFCLVSRRAACPERPAASRHLWAAHLTTGANARGPLPEGKGPLTCYFVVAGAGFEPATSGL